MNAAKVNRVLGWLAGAIVLAVLVVAMVVIGSPLDARKKTADARRVDNLESIAQSVREFYSNNKKLPDRLSQVSVRSYGIKDATVDPMTNQPYGYRVVDKAHFELVAIFETDARKAKTWGYDNDHFNTHAKGKVSFVLAAKQGEGSMGTTPAAGATSAPTASTAAP